MDPNRNAAPPRGPPQGLPRPPSRHQQSRLQQFQQQLQQQFEQRFEQPLQQPLQQPPHHRSQQPLPSTNPPSTTPLQQPAPSSSSRPMTTAGMARTARQTVEREAARSSEDNASSIRPSPRQAQGARPTQADSQRPASRTEETERGRPAQRAMPSQDARNYPGQQARQYPHNPSADPGEGPRTASMLRTLSFSPPRSGARRVVPLGSPFTSPPRSAATSADARLSGAARLIAKHPALASAQRTAAQPPLPIGAAARRLQQVPPASRPARTQQQFNDQQQQLADPFHSPYQQTYNQQFQPSQSSGSFLSGQMSLLQQAQQPYQQPSNPIVGHDTFLTRSPERPVSRRGPPDDFQHFSNPQRPLPPSGNHFQSLDSYGRPSFLPPETHAAHPLVPPYQSPPLQRNQLARHYGPSGLTQPPPFAPQVSPGTSSLARSPEPSPLRASAETFRPGLGRPLPSSPPGRSRQGAVDAGMGGSGDRRKEPRVSKSWTNEDVVGLDRTAGERPISEFEDARESGQEAAAGNEVVTETVMGEGRSGDKDDGGETEEEKNDVGKRSGKKE